MFNLNSSLPNESAAWDTNYARKHLQISEDQLGMINKIIGVSKPEISEKLAAENDKTSEKQEKQLALQALVSTEKLATITSISAKDNNLKNQNNSDLQFKQNPTACIDKKELFLKNVSLSPLRKKSVYSLQRSSSLPDLHKILLPSEVLSHSNSEEIYRKRIHSIEKDTSSFKLASVLKDTLNNTYRVSYDVLDYKLFEKNCKYFSYPLENVKLLSKESFKTLDDNILNHKYLKDAETFATSDDPLFSKEAVQAALKGKMSLFEKKFLLLEKRLFPSKEMTPPLSNSKLLNTENSNSEKNLKSPGSPVLVEVVTAVSNSSENKTEELENSSVLKNYKSLESLANLQSPNENIFESAKDGTDNASKTAACGFESFLSPSLPCGQPVPTEVLSQPIPLQKSVELSSLSKLKNTGHTVSYGQLQLTEVPSLSQPILSQNSTKLNTPNKSQNAELPCKTLALENASGTFSVFSANLNEKVSNLASNKELGAKRKRKSRNEKSSKKLDFKKLKRADIHFSSAQISSMIEMMKLFHNGF